MSDSVWPRRRQPTRLLRPWDSPDKNTGVGCHFLLQCMKVKNESEVAQSCPTLSDPTDSSPPGSSVPGILQARTLEWVAISFSYETPIMWMLMHLMLSHRSLRLSSFFFFLFFFLYSVLWHWFAPLCPPGHLSVLCLSYSALNSFQCIIQSLVFVL